MLERVYAVDEYYDGPEVGYADFKGSPHRFEVIDEWEIEESRVRIFRLFEITCEHLSVVLEAHRLWARWHEKYRRGELQDGVSGGCDVRVLPEDREAHALLKARQSELVKIESSVHAFARGEFVPGGVETEYRAFCETSLVNWLDVPSRMA